MKTVKYIISVLVWTIVVVVLTAYILLHIPVVQAFIGEKASSMLRQKLGTEVSIGKVDLSELGNILIDGFTLYDQQGDTLLHASRLSAGIDIMPLTKGRIYISSAQLFDMDARLYQIDADSKPNFQFVLDSLASKDTVSTPLDLHIASAIIRRGVIRYDRWDKATTPGLFNTSHIKVTDLNAFMILPKLTDQEIDLIVKRLSGKEHSGLQINELGFHFKADKQEANLADLSLKLPNSSLKTDLVKATYSIKDGKLQMPSLLYSISTIDAFVTPSDLTIFIPQLQQFNESVKLHSSLTGTASEINANKLLIETDGAVVDAHGYYNFGNDWNVNMNEVRMTEKFIDSIVAKLSKESISLPSELTRLGNVTINGEAGGTGGIIYTKSTVSTDAGLLKLKASYQPTHVIADLQADEVKVGHIIDNPAIGNITANISATGNPKQAVNVKGTVNGDFIVAKKNTSVDMDLDLSVAGLALDKINGDVNIAKLQMSTAEKDYTAENIRISATNNHAEHLLMLSSDFGDIRIDGIIDPATLPQSVANYVGRRISTLPGLPALTNDKNNDFAITATLYNTDLLQAFFDIPLSINEPLHLDADVRDRDSEISLTTSLPSFTYDNVEYRNAYLDISTEDSIRVEGQISKIGDSGTPLALNINAVATNNALNSHITWDNNHSRHEKHVRGTLNSSAEFFKNNSGKDAIHMRIHPSDVLVGDTAWTIQPSDIIYSSRNLLVDYFSIRHNYQHITIEGRASDNPNDSINVDFKDVDVSYILDLVDFHTVEFSGQASGTAHAKGLFADLNAYANVLVNNFKFENGRMGILEANVNWDNEEGRINIDALANDESDRRTDIDGYVSISQNYIDLNIQAENTFLEFLESFCGSFMANTDLYGTGNVRIFGDLSDVNLTGDLIARGGMDISTTGVRYNLKNARIHAEPDEIYFLNDTVYDNSGNKGLVTGALHHQSLTNLTFDINVEAQHLLCYDFPDYNGATFYGTVYANGNCAIEGRKGRITFDIAGTPEQDSFIEYNAASPDAIRNSDFIVWRDKNEVEIARSNESAAAKNDDDSADTSTDIYLNFLINLDQNFTLRLLMDESSRDYIALNGDGVMRATFHNKGTFDMFGTYNVDHGIYKLTIQNVIKKDFQFQPGSTIVFGGDPYDAALNMKAMYTVNGVSLSDLQLGNSFSSNNVRVDCMMNITGTPQTPHVDFDFDLPTVNSDAKNMVRSLINSEEELNQQVIYLLSIGRFYAGNTNNNEAEENAQQSQTTLAMQSLLSGTISQQINNVLSSWFNNNNWNFGANISTGDEGWSNAEYEGILSGRMFNNRLLINGQFGYRDNAKNATTSFIGDFDIRYLLFPNGNLAVKVYNQTNDRYFTKNSLNTQGIGIIIKHDF